MVLFHRILPTFLQISCGEYWVGAWVTQIRCSQMRTHWIEFDVVANVHFNHVLHCSYQDMLRILREECSKPGLKSWVGVNTEIRIKKLNVTWLLWLNMKPGFQETPNPNKLYHPTWGLPRLAKLPWQDWSHSGGWPSRWLHGKPFLHEFAISRPDQLLVIGRMCVWFWMTVWFWLNMTLTFELWFWVHALSDLPEPLQRSVVRGSYRHPPALDDIICLVKKYIGDGELSQPPLLVMTRRQASSIPNIPTDRHPLRTVSDKVKKDWQKLANAVQSFYGDSYKPAALYLQRLLADFFYNSATLENLQWLQQDHARYAGEPVFSLHKCVLDTLAPSQPLRAVWQRGWE